VTRPQPRPLLLAALLLLLSATALARPAVAPPAEAELRATVEALTAPGMDGRRSGTPGGALAAERIAGWLRVAGLRPGGERESFFQSFAVGRATRVAAGTALATDGRMLDLGRDWTPHGGSAQATLAGELAFVGYGVSAPGYDDWAGVDVRDRLALALEGAPPHLAGVKTSRLEKLIAARRAGARALLVVSDTLPSLAATAAGVRLVSGSVTPAAADALLAPTGTTTAQLASRIAERRAPASFVSTGDRVQVRVALESVDRRAANVVGVLPGTDAALADEAVVLGAHYDHLGVMGGSVYPGADDNASGTAVVVGLARAFAAAGPRERTLVFALFAAEEAGLLGSGEYVREPAVPVARTAAMLNFDMVGRLRDGSLAIAGVASGRGLRDVVSEAARAAGVKASLRESPYGPSDHSRFYGAGAPVLFFHTGSHADYHRPGDTADKIDAAGMARVAALAARIAERLARAPRPAYVALPRPTEPHGDRAVGASRPFLGVGADSGESDGLRLAQVVANSAAARAGLEDGDVLVRFGDHVLNGFDDLLAALRERRPGDAVPVRYLRDGLDHDTTATLEARP
jgi:peptidase M28-like protein/PDZ domain-containing protein